MSMNLGHCSGWEVTMDITRLISNEPISHRWCIFYPGKLHRIFTCMSCYRMQLQSTSLVKRIYLDSFTSEVCDGVRLSNLRKTGATSWTYNNIEPV